MFQEKPPLDAEWFNLPRNIACWTKIINCMLQALWTIFQCPKMSFCGSASLARGAHRGLMWTWKSQVPLRRSWNMLRLWRSYGRLLKGLFNGLPETLKSQLNGLRIVGTGDSREFSSLSMSSHWRDMIFMDVCSALKTTKGFLSKSPGLSLLQLMKLVWNCHSINATSHMTTCKGEESHSKKLRVIRTFSLIVCTKLLTGQLNLLERSRVLWSPFPTRLSLPWCWMLLPLRSLFLLMLKKQSVLE